MDLADILQELGRTTGLGPLALDGNELCRLVFDDELTVDIERVPGRGRFFLHATVGQAPEPEAPVLAEMLAANLFGAGTGDAVLALDQRLGEVVLLRGFDEGTVDHARFAAALETFLRALEDWRRRLARAGTEGGAEARARAGTAAAAVPPVSAIRA